MFSDCRDLSSITLGSTFYTGNVENMRYMFARCTSLTSLDLSNFNTSKVTDMSYMFAICTSLTSLDLSNFNTSRGIDMSYMFAACTSLIELDLRNFEIVYGTQMKYMFKDLEKLREITIGPGFFFVDFGNGEELLPAPDPTKISGADGKWYKGRTGYTPQNLQEAIRDGALNNNPFIKEITTFVAVPGDYSYEV
jgi:surface protein